MKSSPRLLLSSLITIGTISIANANNYTLNLLTTFGPNGDGTVLPENDISLPTGYETYGVGGTNAFHQRGMSCDPVSGNLVLVDTHSGSGGSTNVMGSIFVIDGTSGIQTGTLSTNGILGGSYADVPAGIADDGVVFICNQVGNSTNNPFKIYRYQSLTDPNPPIVAFSNTLPAPIVAGSTPQRYGESMDVRGSGAGTQIIIGSMLGSTATNVVIFTTTDGTNFTANVIGVTNVITGGLGQFSDSGIAFGPTNTFWAKSVTAPLRYLRYDLAQKTATILATHTTTNLPGVRNLGPISVNTNLNLLAAIEEANGNVLGGPERVWLFDISGGGLVAPKLLSITNFIPNNQNATAPLGYLDFNAAGSRLYAHVVNNGDLALTVDSVATPLPIIDTQPVNPTNRVAIGQTAHWEVLAYPNITGYQWKTNGVPIPGATSYFLDVPNVQLADSGRIYSVDVINAAGTTTSSNSTLSVLNPADLFHLSLLWSFAANATNYFTNPTGGGVPDVRSLAYNPVANHLIVVKRSGVAANNAVSIYVINPNTGEFLWNMNTNGVILTNINIALLYIGVADDGAVYICNGNSGAGTAANFRVYRWADDSTSSYPTNIFTGNPAGGATSSTDFRWGDVMSVRGAGVNTQLILDNQDTATFRFAAVLRPSGADLNQPWTGKGFVLQNTEGGATIGRSLQFGRNGTDTFWQKRFLAGGSGLVRSSFNLNDADPALAAVEVNSKGGELFTNAAANINFAFNLAAAVNFAAAPAATATVPDTLVLYDFTSPETPVTLNRYNFAVNKLANNNAIAEVIFATNNVLGTNYVFAFDANNGIMGLTLSTGPLPKPTILSQPKNQRSVAGNNVTLSVVLDIPATNQWQRDSGGGVFTNVPAATNTSFTITSAQVSDSGFYRVFAGNSSGSVTSTIATVTLILASDNYSLTQIWATNSGFASTDGGSNTPKERSLAYNAASNQLLVVRGPVAGNPSTSVPEVHVIDANTGIELYTLNVSTIVSGTESEQSGSNPLNLTSIAAAEDGNIYACNEVPNASGGVAYSETKLFRVYRWTNSSPSTVPIQIFYGDPSVIPTTNNGVNLRFGDVITVRGSGINTEILLDDQVQGVGAGILRPADATLNTFTNIPIVIANGGGSIGRSLQFVNPPAPDFIPSPLNTATNFWQKRKSLNLNLTTYNTNTQTGILATNFANFPSTLGATAIDPVRNLAVGVEFTGNGTSTSDQVGLYEISDPTIPVLIARYNFPVTPNTANANFIASTAIGGNKVFSLDGNNGIVAFKINGPSLTITPSGSNVILTWPLFTGYTLQASPAVAPPPLTWTNVGTGTISGGKYSLTTPASATALFYRLSK